MKLLNVKEICKSLMYDTDEPPDNSLLNLLVQNNDLTSTKRIRLTRREMWTHKEFINSLIVKLNSK